MVREDGVAAVGEDDVECKQCGTVTPRATLLSTGGPDDPLQVYECAECASVVDVGGHRW